MKEECAYYTTEKTSYIFDNDSSLLSKLPLDSSYHLYKLLRGDGVLTTSDI